MFLDITTLTVIGCGFITGLAVGYTSVGVGSISTTGLLLFTSFSPAQIIASNIFNGLIIKILGSIKHWQHNHIKLRVSIPFIIVGVPLAVFGSVFSRSIEVSSYRHLMSAVLIIFSFIIFYEADFFEKRKLGIHLSDFFRKRQIVCAVFLGGVIGFVTGFTSLGSGQMMIIGLLILQRLPSKESVGTALFCGAAILFASALTHLFMGNLHFGLTFKLMLGSLPGVWIGSHCCHRSDHSLVKKIIAAIIFVGGILVLIKKF